MDAFWLRQDFRVHDNTALYHAAKNRTGVVAVYLLCPSSWRRHHVGAAQVQWQLDHLQGMQANLAAYHIPLKIIRLERLNQSTQALLDFCRKQRITALHFNHAYEWDERQRDRAIIKAFEKHDTTVHAYHDLTLLEPGSVLNQQSKAYTVFTPFKKAVYKRLIQDGVPQPLPLPHKQPTHDTPSSRCPAQIEGFASQIDRDWCPPGEKAAMKRLRSFCKDGAKDYHATRDFPGLDQTSRLSPYLAIGVLSVRQCLAQLLSVYERGPDTLPKGPKTWLDELLWRDFYKHILWHFPRVSRDQPFNLATKRMTWRNDPKIIKAWQTGQTGFPLVDAAMRQLNQTGWMHNRLRMVTAMFLTKNGDVDWRIGEQYFSEHLLDLDLSANNGGWQWSASTGTDAAPYFRVFNPITQSQRFDPDGEFIKQYCPELNTLDKKTIHEPGDQRPDDYPPPIVDHKATRQASIEKFKRQTR